jgi:DNA-binding NarL/FixJ family response regulator
VNRRVSRRRTLLIAAAQPLLRQGLASVLVENDFEVVAQADNADRAIAAAEGHCPAICIIDADLPGGCIHALKRITDRLSGTGVIVLAQSLDSETVVAAVRAGADGIIMKTSTSGGLVRAVEAVLSGHAAIPRAALAGLVDEFRGLGRRGASVDGARLPLTGREAQVFDLLRENLTTAEIARELSLSQVTVRRHLGSIAAKAGGKTARDLLRPLPIA